MLLELKQGDTRPIRGSLKKVKGGALLPLAGAVLTWRMLPAVGAPGDPFIASMEVLDPAGRFEWVPDDLHVAASGIYRGLIHILYADGSEQTVPTSGYIDVVIQPVGA